ncbi:hypothetical protein [Lampropedia aestuarii]|uniref:hypothetical protein n=1 Tax=Lampropedia aestuarii TaxID=2562762 RepID=UPI002468D907|nr:hypothetical protein [Lampropedia aestuarii]MDH5857762.1 hypothetical protein [Lampropedia aestuarii]
MTTPTLRELIEEADALLGYCSDQTSTAKDAIGTLEGIRASLAAQPELPEPAAWRHSSTLSLHDSYEDVELADGDSFAEPLYTAAQLQQAVESAAINAVNVDNPRVGVFTDSAYANGLSAGYSLGQMNEEAKFQQILGSTSALIREARSALNEQARTKREPMTQERMQEIFLAKGFTVKAGQDDLKDYVYAAGRAIEAHHGIGDKA